MAVWLAQSRVSTTLNPSSGPCSSTNSGSTFPLTSTQARCLPSCLPSEKRFSDRRSVHAIGQTSTASIRRCGVNFTPQVYLAGCSSNAGFSRATGRPSPVNTSSSAIRRSRLHFCRSRQPLRRVDFQNRVKHSSTFHDSVSSPRNAFGSRNGLRSPPATTGSMLNSYRPNT